MTIDHYDSTFPRYGAILKDREMREALISLATHQRGQGTDGTSAQIIADTFAWPKNLSSSYNLNLKMGDGTTTYGPVDIDLRSGGSSPASSRTLADVINAINTAMTSEGATVAVAFDVDGYLFLKCPFKGANSYITIGNAASNDAKEIVLNLADRDNVSYPYTINGTDPLPGYLRADILDTTLNREDLQYCYDQGAEITSPFYFPTGTVDTTQRYKLHLRLENYQRAIITLPKGASTTLEAIVSAINAQYASIGTVAYVIGTGGNKRIRLKSPYKPSDPAAGVKLDSKSRIEIHYVDSDASPILFGLQNGVDPSGVGNIGGHMTYPYVIQTEIWNPAGIRDIGYCPGIGVWGPPFDFGLNNLRNSVVSFHGEIRLDRESGIPNMFWDKKDDTWDNSSTYREGWHAAVPGGYPKQLTEDYYGPDTFGRLTGVHKVEHVKYDKDRGAYILDVGTHKTYGTTAYTLTDYNVGQIPELVDLYRDWYPSKSSFRISSGIPTNGSLKRETPVTDNFNRSNTTSLGSNWWNFIAGIEISSNKAFSAPFGNAGAYNTPHSLWKTGFTRVNCDVMAQFYFSPAGPTASDKEGAFFSLIHSAKFIDTGGTSDPDGWERGYAARIDDRGVLKVYRRDGYDSQTGQYVETLLAGRSVSLDPIPDGTARVLRFRRNGSNIKVFWNGSLDPTKWNHEVPVFSYEDDSGLAPPSTGPNFLDYAHTGLEMHPSELSVGRAVYSDNWATVVIEPDSEKPEYACLPEIGGHHLRGIITSVAEETLHGATGEVINDATPDSPLLFAAGDGIVISQDTANKKITIGTSSGLTSGPSGTGIYGWQGAPTAPNPIGSDYDDYRWDDGDFGSQDGGSGTLTIASDEMSTLIVDYVALAPGSVDPFLRLSVADVNLDPDVMGAYNRLGNVTTTPATGFKDWTSKAYARLGLSLDRNTLHTTLRSVLKYLAENVCSWDGTLPSWLSGLNSYLTPSKPYTITSLTKNRFILGIFTSSSSLPTRALGLAAGQTLQTGTLALIETGKIYWYNYDLDQWSEVQLSSGISVREAANDFSSISQIRFGADAQGNGFSITKVGSEVRIALDLQTGLKFQNNGLAIDFGSSASKAAIGDHIHGFDGYSLIPWDSISGKPSTFPPNSHSYASHTGFVPAEKVFDVGAFQSGGNYYLRASSGSVFIGGTAMDVILGSEDGNGGVVHVGHDGTNPLVPAGKFKIADHNHSGAGSGGRIAYANLLGIPTRFTPAFHNQQHYIDGDDPIVGDHLRIDYVPTNYTGGTKLVNHLTGIGAAIAAVPKYGTMSLSGSVDLRDWSEVPPRYYEMQNLPIAIIGGASTNAGVTLPAPYSGGSWLAKKLLISTNRPCTAGKSISFKVIVYKSSGGSEVEQELSWTPQAGALDHAELSLNSEAISATDKVRVIVSSMDYTAPDDRFACEGLMNVNLVLSA